MLAVFPCCDNATKVDDTAHRCCSVVVARVQLLYDMGVLRRIGVRSSSRGEAKRVAFVLLFWLG